MKTLRTLIVLIGLASPYLSLADETPPEKTSNEIKAEAKADAKPEAKAEAKEDLQAAAKPDKEGYTAVMPGEQLGAGESLPAANLVGAAYGFILATLVAWVASVALRARKVEEELAALRAKIDKQA